MKILNRIILIVVALLVSSSVSAQQPSPTEKPAVKQERRLARFDLDFPGGTPRQLVDAIQKATGRPLNAIVPDQYADRKLPPLKMKGVDVSELFNAMFRASFGVGLDAPGGFGFVTLGPLTDDSIWYISVSGAFESQESCRFYLLTPHLQAGLTVDDITTAIQTSWKMMGDVKPSKLSYHKETKLLIAVGAGRSLQIIDDVLKALNVQQKISPISEASAAK